MAGSHYQRDGTAEGLRIGRTVGNAAGTDREDVATYESAAKREGIGTGVESEAKDRAIRRVQFGGNIAGGAKGHRIAGDATARRNRSIPVGRTVEGDSCCRRSDTSPEFFDRLGRRYGESDRESQRAQRAPDGKNLERMYGILWLSSYGFCCVNLSVNGGPVILEKTVPEDVFTAAVASPKRFYRVTRTGLAPYDP